MSLTATVILIIGATAGHAASLAEGTTLYNSYCSGCHGALASSDYLGATPSMISAGIASVSGMKKFGATGTTPLTDDQILSISIALGGATVPPPPPPATISLTSSVSGSTVNLSWTIANLTGVSSYSVLRNGVSVGSTAAMSYANTGVANGTYSYQVRALSSTGTVLATSNTVSAIVNVAPAPAPSVTLTSSVSSSTVTLSWTIANLTGVSSYQVMRGGVAVGSSATTSYADSGLANGTYSYQVRALGSTGAVLATSNTVSATVNVAPTPVPTGTITLSGSVSGKIVTLNWTVANLTGSYSYKVFKNGKRVAATTSTSYTKSRLAIGTYSYQVYAVVKGGSVLAKSNVVVVTVAPAVAPTVAPTTAILDGATLYNTYCSSCHKALSSSTVMGKSAGDIKEAIVSNKGGMGSLKLTDAQIQAIGTTLTTGFTSTDCSGCHNADGSLKGSVSTGSDD